MVATGPRSAVSRSALIRAMRRIDRLISNSPARMRIGTQAAQRGHAGR